MTAAQVQTNVAATTETTETNKRRAREKKDAYRSIEGKRWVEKEALSTGS